MELKASVRSTQFFGLEKEYTMEIAIIILGAFAVILVAVIYGLGRRIVRDGDRIAQLEKEKSALIQRIMLYETFGNRKDEGR